MIIANENTKYQLKQIITEIIYILNTELKQRTHYENDRISINHIPIINIFRGQRIGINTKGQSEIKKSLDTQHWRIEGGPRGPCPPPPKLVKV